MNNSSVLIAGGGPAAFAVIQGLRQRQFAGDITLLSAEQHPPYQRPPLSKQVLEGTWESERTYLITDRALADYGVRWCPGEKAAALNVADRLLWTAAGNSIRFVNLVIATGAAPGRLPWHRELRGLYELRTIEDAMALMHALSPGVNVAIIGAGFIGSEVAAASIARGAEVTMIDPRPAPLVDALGLEVGTEIEQLHASHGVRVLTNRGVTSLNDEAGRVTGVQLTDGTRLAADVVVVGVGARPNDSWLLTSGLQVADGVVCDQFSRVQPGIFAAGDVARWTDDRTTTTTRVGHHTNALEQGDCVAENLLAVSDFQLVPYRPVPYFWSDQFGKRIQFVGQRRSGDREVVLRRTSTDGRLLVAWATAGRLSAAAGIAAPRDVLICRRAIAAGESLACALESLNVQSKLGRGASS